MTAKNTTIDELCKLSDEVGIVNVLSQLRPGITVNIPVSGGLRDSSIEDLTLSVRSRNGLMRSGLNTVGKVCQKIMDENGLSSLRCIGKKSIAEIKTVILQTSYSELSPQKKSAFWENLININHLQKQEEP